MIVLFLLRVMSEPARTLAGMAKTILHQIIESADALSTATKRKYGAAVDRWVAYAGADSSAWTTENARSFYDDLRSQVSVHTANHVLHGLRYAAKRWPGGDFTAIPLAKAPSRTRKPAMVLTATHAQKLIDACQGDTPVALRDCALVTIGWEKRMRPAELARLTWDRLPRGVRDALVAWRAWCRRQGVTNGYVFRRVRRTLDGWKLYGRLSQQAVINIVSTRAQQAGIGRIARGAVLWGDS